MKKGCLKGLIAAIVIGLFALGLIIYLAAQDAKETPKYTVIENKQHDIPVKSQISLRVALTDTTATSEEVKELLHLLVKSSSNLKMKHHDKPTNVYVYIYKTKASYEAEPASWLMMYAKNRSDEEGTYTYQPLLPFR